MSHFPTPNAPGTRETRRSREGRTWLAALVTLVVLAAAVLWWRSGGDAPPGSGAGSGKAPREADEQEPIAYLVGPRAGRWHAPRTNLFDEDLTDEQREEIAELEAIGYAAGVHEAEEDQRSGVLRHDRERSDDGVLRYTSAHAAESRLIDREGRVLHRWSHPFWEVWPDYPHRNKLATFWRRTHLFPNGDLIGIYEGLGIIRIDRDSKLLWASSVRAHHDLHVLPDGRLWVLSREAHVVPSIHPHKPVLEDFVSLLDGGTGEELERFSLIEAFAGTELEQDWRERIHLGGDLFHTNSLEVLDGSLAAANPAFAEGNFLLSMLLLDLVVVVDGRTKKVVWGRVGPYDAQHDPQALDSGSVMVFDNQGGRVEGETASRVLELDPRTWEVRWSFEGSAREPFYSETCGLAQRLDNGNTLVTETDYGRAFEVTPGGDVVWEFQNPHRAGDRSEFVATLMEMIRLPDDFPLDWTAR